MSFYLSSADLVTERMQALLDTDRALPPIGDPMNDLDNMVRTLTANDLLDVIDDLTAGRIVTTVLDDGSKHNEFHDALIKQLREAIASSMVGGAVAAGSKTSLPFDADALELYQAIERDISIMYVDHGLGVPGLLPEDNLRALYAHRWRDGEAPEELIRGWRKTILDKFDPLITVPLKDPCPVCKSDHWYAENGDRRSNPVVITYRRGDPFATVKAVCHGSTLTGEPCGTEWYGAEAITELVDELTELFDSEPETAVSGREDER